MTTAERMRRRAPRLFPRTRVEHLPTSDLLALHERYFGPLDAAGKRRIVRTAAAAGWDRDWEMDGVAA